MMTPFMWDSDKVRNHSNFLSTSTETGIDAQVLSLPVLKAIKRSKQDSQSRKGSDNFVIIASI